GLVFVGDWNTDRVYKEGSIEAKDVGGPNPNQRPVIDMPPPAVEPPPHRIEKPEVREKRIEPADTTDSETKGVPVLANGLDGANGGYLLPDLTTQQLAKIALGLPLDKELQKLLEKWSEGMSARDPKRAPSVDVQDPGDLAKTGWAVVFSEKTKPEVRRALADLLEHRSKQAGQGYREFTVGTLRSSRELLVELGVKQGAPADASELPYYVLLVASPEEISYHLQSELDVQYAVGRLHFDRTADYAAYAKAVIDAEEGPGRPNPVLIFFAVENPADEATRQTASGLIEPLAKVLESRRKEWKTGTIAASDSTKVRLRGLLGGAETPSILFTASHGVGFPVGDERQLGSQGGIVCQDWPGPSAKVGKDHYFTADDLAADAKLRGLIAFHFACY